MSSRDDAVAFWDAEIGRWARGDIELSPDLNRWMGAYEGRGEGSVERTAFPEPYIGPLAGNLTPALVMLGLNPGAAALDFQGQGGLFTRQIAASSYSQWAGTAPYTGEAWESAMGKNRYHRNRLSFARRLHQRENLRAEDLLYVELYPFHSRRVTGAIDPDPDVLDRFVFGPIGDLDVGQVFAFGKPWTRVAERIGLGVGEPLRVTWQTPSREARSYRLPTGQDLIILSQNGYAGPPGEADTETLRCELRL